MDSTEEELYAIVFENVENQDIHTYDRICRVLNSDNEKIVVHNGYMGLEKEYVIVYKKSDLKKKSIQILLSLPSKTPIKYRAQWAAVDDLIDRVTIKGAGKRSKKSKKTKRSKKTKGSKKK